MTKINMHLTLLWAFAVAQIGVVLLTAISLLVR
jgi:hypothetical protein